jgi:hypothetical protein
MSENKPVPITHLTKTVLKKDDRVWSLHHSQIPGFTFIYEKLVEAADKFRTDTELLERFREHRTPHLEQHYQKQLEDVDETYYDEVEKLGMSCDGMRPDCISMHSSSSHKPLDFFKKYTLVENASGPPLNRHHITMSGCNIRYSYGHITSAGAMLNCSSHPIAKYMDAAYKSIYGHIQYTMVRGLFWYPKGGFREWHTNRFHLSGWRLYLIECDEDERSWFAYKHPKTGITHRIPDRRGYINIFKVTKDPPLWHNVYSQTNRFSLGIHVTDEFMDNIVEFV